MKLSEYDKVIGTYKMYFGDLCIFRYIMYLSVTLGQAKVT